MIRNEHHHEGVLVAADTIDLDAGTVTQERDGKVTGTRALTADERARYAPAPPAPEDRIAALEAEVRAIKGAAAAEAAKASPTAKGVATAVANAKA